MMKVSGSGVLGEHTSVPPVNSRLFAEELKMSRMMDVRCSMLAVEGGPVISIGNGLSSKVSYFLRKG